MLLLWSLVPQGRRQNLLWNFLSALAIGGVTAAALWMRLLPSLAVWAGIDISAQSGFEGQVAMAGLALGAGVAVFLMLCLPAVEERLLPDESTRVGMLSATLRITLCVVPTAMFAFLAARSIPPERFGFWGPMERALAPVILGAFAYWLLIGIFGVKEYDELRAALGRRKGADTGRPA